MLEKMFEVHITLKGVVNKSKDEVLKHFPVLVIAADVDQVKRKLKELNLSGQYTIRDATICGVNDILGELRRQAKRENFCNKDVKPIVADEIVTQPCS